MKPKGKIHHVYTKYETENDRYRNGGNTSWSLNRAELNYLAKQTGVKITDFELITDKAIYKISREKFDEVKEMQVLGQEEKYVIPVREWEMIIKD